VSFLSGVVETLRKTAPLRVVAARARTGVRLRAGAGGGRLDIVIGNWPSPPGQLHLSPLLDDELVCVMADTNPLARKELTVDQYLAAPHVVPDAAFPSHAASSTPISPRCGSRETCG
jgi:DNA-binding transcriptional LysR family regulator